MDEMKKAMKYSLVFGICGSVVIPVICELYANISKDFALFLFACYIVFAGVKFSSLHAKEAMLGMTAMIAYSGVLAIPVYLVVHPAVKSMLEKRSQYFQLTFQQSLRLIIMLALTFLLMYLVWIARAGINKAAAKFRSNSEKTKEYIDNAFDDTGDGQ